MVSLRLPAVLVPNGDELLAKAAEGVPGAAAPARDAKQPRLTEQGASSEDTFERLLRFSLYTQNMRPCIFGTRANLR